MDANYINTIRGYYSSAVEKDRLESDYFLLEGIRTKEVITRYTGERKHIVDIGGGAGYYSFWLAAQGHDVHLIDFSEENIKIATEAEEKGFALRGITLGNATQLPYADHSFEMALMLGPLYHLTGRNDRIQALAEARRVLRPGGILICAIISRYASLMDGYQRDLVNDPEFRKILSNDLKSGIHINHTSNPEYFTTSYFHTPDEIADEIRGSGMTFEKLIAVEGFGVIVADLARKLKDQEYRSKLLSDLELVESNRDLMAMSPHILAVARK
jgi:ubiquinone/menaquinone biosynthesis C-methylase UbiE